MPPSCCTACSLQLNNFKKKSMKKDSKAERWIFSQYNACLQLLVEEYEDVCQIAETYKLGSSLINKRLCNRKYKRCSRVLPRYQLYLGLSGTCKAPQNLIQIWKTFSSLVRYFYSKVQWPWEMEDQFANELQILSWKVISVRSSWKDKVNEALKTQFTFQLCDPYFTAMAYNYLKTQGQKMTFTQFLAECISMFGLCTKLPKVKPATNSVSSSGAPMEQNTYPQK